MDAAPIPGRPEDMGTLIVELHMTDDDKADDDSPMQMISTSRLAYYRRLESAARGLIAAIAGAPDGG